MSIISDLFEINKRLSYDLWHLKNIGEEVNELSPNLILPYKRIKKVARLSEQEAKIIFCNILDRLNYFYSIETPTNKSYKQKGESARSANIDISLYSELISKEKRKISRVANIELKAHNPSLFSYKKDIEKLIRESLPGNWVHIFDGFQNHRKNYFDKVKNKIIKSLLNLKKYAEENNEISIVFYFHSIEERWACMKHLNFNFKNDKNYKQYVNNFFDIDINLIEKNNKNSNYYFVKTEKNSGWYTISMREFHDAIK